jgi:hypothetical protein
MIELTTELVRANPEGADVRLTCADLWRGLVWKATMPTAFVSPIKACQILERLDDGFLREIEHVTAYGTEPVQERVFLEPERTVTFIRLSGSVLGRIVNRIEEDSDGELGLRFGYTLAVDGMAHGSPEEAEYRRTFSGGYLAAVDATLGALREFVRTGVDPTAEQPSIAP